MNKYPVLVRNLVITFLAAVIIGAVFNIIAALLPTGRIHQNVMDATAVFLREGVDPHSIAENDASLGDNNTDAWMLLIADYNGKGVVNDRVYEAASDLDRSQGGIKALLSRAFDGISYFYGIEDSGLVGSDNIMFVGEPEPDTVWLYPRYWHGWMLPLKLLLMIFSYSDIRLLLFIVHTFLLFAIILAFAKRERILTGIAFAAAVIAMFPTTYMISVDYSMCTLIMEMSMLALVAFNEWFDKKYGRYIVLFLIIGIATAYFDFLTFPTITLTFPMIIWIINVIDSNRYNEAKVNIKGIIIEFILCGLMWAVGYFGMWASKWVICTIFTDPNMISDVIHQIRFRTSDTAEDVTITIGEVFARNFAKFNYLPLEIMGVAVLLISLLPGKWKRPEQIGIVGVVLLIVVAIIPVIWLMLLSNHAYLHDHFTYRNLAGMFFAILVAIQELKGCKLFSGKIAERANYGTSKNNISE